MNRQHLDNFTSFVHAELACGGPDPHLKIANWIAAQTKDPAWFLGLYTMVYNVPSAEVLLHYLPEPDYISGLQAMDLWQRIIVRKERRVNGFGPVKLQETINGYVEFLEKAESTYNQPDVFPDFPDQFEHLKNSVKNYGRYFGMKLFESLRRAEVYELKPFSDIRPKDGQMARKGLALIYPEHDYKAKDNLSCMDANDLAAQLIQHVEKERGDKLDWFLVEVMLCNYRQAFAGSQYPGRGHDSELDHLHTVAVLNPELTFKTLEARKVLFPPWALGELQGWEGRRPLGKVMNQFGYVWSDRVFNYNLSKEKDDFSNPIIQNDWYEEIHQKYDALRDELEIEELEALPL